jgi:hypothetical protein
LYHIRQPPPGRGSLTQASITRSEASRSGNGIPQRAQIGAGEVHEAARVLPVFEYTRDDREKQVVGAVGGR